MAKEILVADSDKTAWEEFKKAFADTEYRLIFAGNGEDAYQQILLFRPNLVIAGITLGKKGGLELCRDIKSDQDCRLIPVVLLKGILEEFSDQDLDQARADGVISKPLRREEILGLVEKLTAEGTMKNKKGSLASELEKLDEEEIIELVDVVEEPESRVKMSDLMAPEKEEFPEEINPLETWEPLKKETLETPSNIEEERPESELTLSFDEEMGKKAEETDLHLGDETFQAEEVSEKIDFEDILQKVDEIRPSFPEETVEAKETYGFREISREESPERVFSLEEFETALKGVKAEPVREDTKSFFMEEPGKEASTVEIPPLAVERPAEGPGMMPPYETTVKPAAEPAPKGAASEEDLQSLFKEESLEEAPTEVPLVEEEFGELPEEEFPEALLEEEELGEGEMTMAEMPTEQKMGVTKMVQEEAVPVATRLDKQAEELITKGIQIMMEDFVKKIVPEIAQVVMTMTLERIEQMVKEIVPELAEKAIQAEIKRLQGADKD